MRIDARRRQPRFLRIIGNSPADVQPVFDTIVANAVILCNGLFSALVQFDGTLIRHVADHNFTTEALAEVRGCLPDAPKSKFRNRPRNLGARGSPHTYVDVTIDPDYGPSNASQVSRACCAGADLFGHTDACGTGWPIGADPGWRGDA